MSLPRRAVVLTALLLAVAVVAVGAPPWVGADVPTVIGTRRVDLSGSAAAPGLTAAALVVGAAALAIGIGRRVGSVIGALALVGAGALVAAATVAFLGDPGNAVLGAAAQVSGVRQIDGAASVAPWPWVALALAAVLVLLGVLALGATRTWGSTGRRFERPAPEAPAPRSASTEATEVRTRAMDDWDAFGRGEDPSGPAP
ncbi:Trp biosynthesis-associated membrane protein [Georgenia sp.]